MKRLFIFKTPKSQSSAQRAAKPGRADTADTSLRPVPASVHVSRVERFRKRLLSAQLLLARPNREIDMLPVDHVRCARYRLIFEDS